MAELPDPDRDGHWRSQTGMLCLDLIDYGVLGRFETFAADFASVLRGLDAPDELRDGLDAVVGASLDCRPRAPMARPWRSSSTAFTRPTS